MNRPDDAPPADDWSRLLGVFDLETTGVDVETARIVTASVGVLDAAGSVIEGMDWLADPGVEIPAAASMVHGVTTERARRDGVAAATVVAEVVAALRALLAREIPVTAFNAPYDFTLLDREARRHGVEPLAEPAPIVDPLVIDKAVDRFRRGKRTLEAAAFYYGVQLDDAHTAGADSVAAGRVAQAIRNAFPSELSIPAARLHELQITWAAEQAASFQDYMRRVKDPEFVARGEWPVRRA